MGEGLVTKEDVGGASPDIMDPRPENLNSGIWNQHGCDQKRYGWKPALWKIKQEAVVTKAAQTPALTDLTFVCVCVGEGRGRGQWE